MLLARPGLSEALSGRARFFSPFFSPTKLIRPHSNSRCLIQFGSTTPKLPQSHRFILPVCHAEGRGFEPHHPLKDLENSYLGFLIRLRTFCMLTADQTVFPSE
jgi:hypothetical protein